MTVPSRPQPVEGPPESYRALVRSLYPKARGDYLARVLWQRGWRDPQALAGFLRAQDYRETGPEAFGEPMRQAVGRLRQAIDGGEAIAIWGDFDADGVTATAVLFEGLAPFVPPPRLSWVIPDRQIQNHGLHREGLAELAAVGVRLVITADNGCGNPEELAYARALGLEVIVTDHHLLPPGDLTAVAVLNPRILPPSHPLVDLSGVAVAYKLLEGLYAAIPGADPARLAELLDLVAVGLVADLVELRGDCRQLVRRGLQQLASPRLQQRRPGLWALLQACQRAGDRPSDIGFGLGPRINAVSRIRGDVSPLLELLLTRDPERGQALAEEVEVLNRQRRLLQRRLQSQAERQIQRLNLRDHPVLVLAEENWPVGLLGLVAGQLTQTYQRPVLMLSLEPPRSDRPALARGSARTVPGVDLYALLQSQRELLCGFGGHPAAAGLSLPVANLELLRLGLNACLPHLSRPVAARPVDLELSPTDLGPELCEELRGLEPCGMGNPPPLIRVRGVEARQVGEQKGAYAAVRLQLSSSDGRHRFPARWWEHRRTDVPSGPLQVLLEPDYRSRLVDGVRTEGEWLGRILDLQPQADDLPSPPLSWRDERDAVAIAPAPVSWDELTERGLQTDAGVVRLVFHPPEPSEVSDWQCWLGVLRGLAEAPSVPLAAIARRLDLSSPVCLDLLQRSEPLGYHWEQIDGPAIRLDWPDWQRLDFTQPPLRALAITVSDFLQECRLRQRYFTRQSAAVLEQTLALSHPELAQPDLARSPGNP